MSRPKNFDATELRFPCVNTTNEAIPPFAVMALAPSSSDGPPILKHASDYTTLGPGPMEIRVRKPIAEDILLGNPAVFCFNTELPIPSSGDEGKGECTLSLPAFVQIDPNKARERGCSLMPRADSWLLHKGPGMFCLRTWWIDGSIDIGLVDRGQPVQIARARLTTGWTSGTATAQFRPIGQEYDELDPEVTVHDEIENYGDLAVDDELLVIWTNGKVVPWDAKC